MPTVTRETGTQRYMQGVAVPAESVNPAEFFRRTRRHTATERTENYSSANPQPSITFPLLRSDILAGINIRFVGTVTTVKGAGTVATARRWPYDLLKAVKFSANGVSNLINVSGAKLKAREVMKKGDQDDRGVSRTIGAAAVTQGTLSMASESWGVGSGETGIADATYDVDVTWPVPVAEDEIDLAGAIFLATSSTDLSLTIDLATVAELFALTSDAAVTVAGTFQIETTKYSIPIGPNGQIVVPDLSLFHSLIQSRTTELGNAENESVIVGSGAGQSLLRIFWQVWNGAGTAAAPLVQNDANFGLQAWRYGSNETPDRVVSGARMRQKAERLTNCDLGGQYGFGLIDFAAENAFRDVVDLGTTADFRLVTTIGDGVVLASPALEYVTEKVYLSGQAA
ncbi:hypothetical protein Q6348_08030 [Isoptericola sp. b441]|uniref:Major capsid protein n=1 Tax=Actinotalea lenta TaxID=3064654 RepID=A0ABT9DD29_9CELL|nr:hypothetical protein [Isoptericola sp. b441]MDO8107143.1 hypothetical protein [Isoptericola sp. b441]